MIAFQYEAGSTTLLCSNIFPSKVPIYTENELCQKKYTGAAMFFCAKNKYAVRSPKNSNDAIKYHYS